MFSILVLDDEKLVLEGLCRYIEYSRLPLHLIASARSGNEALDICLKHRPDIIITDVKMPGMDGIQLTKEILNIENYTPCIIVISAYSDFSYVQQLIKNPYVIDYILKPIDKVELHKSLVRAISVCKGGSLNRSCIANPSNVDFDLPASCAEFQWNERGITSIAPIVRKVMDFVELHYAEPDITLAEIAKHFYVSPNYLSFCFKKEMGIGFTVYLRNLRVEKSKEFLKDIKLKIYEVAAKVGITDARYYTRIFREVTGESPKEYRKHCL